MRAGPRRAAACAACRARRCASAWARSLAGCRCAAWQREERRRAKTQQSTRRCSKADARRSQPPSQPDSRSPARRSRPAGGFGRIQGRTHHGREGSQALGRDHVDQSASSALVEAFDSPSPSSRPRPSSQKIGSASAASANVRWLAKAGASRLAAERARAARCSACAEAEAPARLARARRPSCANLGEGSEDTFVTAKLIA